MADQLSGSVTPLVMAVIDQTLTLSVAWMAREIERETNSVKSASK